MSAVPRPSLGALFAALLVAASQPGLAAPPAPLTPPKEALPLSEPEVAQRGRVETREIKYSPWRKLCLKAPGKDVSCRTTITGTWDTGQMAIRLDLIDRERQSQLQIILPVGLYLQAGVASFGLIASKFASLTRGASRISASLRFPSAKLPSQRSEKLEPFQSMF